MTEAYRIVIGMDLEDEGDLALMEGLRVGEPLSAELHAVHVIPTRRDTEVLARVLDLGLSRLRERVARVAVSSPMEVRLHVRFGDAATVLHQVAVDYSADLIVVGTHARRGVARAVLGSVAESLVRSARLPVLVARAKGLEELERTPQPDEGRPGAPLQGDQHISEVIRVGPRTSHIAGLV
jgi:nucleotide-binding universal stress UspA family protein